MVHRAVVVRGDVRVEERHLHGAQAGRGARAEAARIEAQQQVQLVLDGLHLGAGQVWEAGFGPGAWFVRGGDGVWLWRGWGFDPRGVEWAWSSQGAVAGGA